MLLGLLEQMKHLCLKNTRWKSQVTKIQFFMVRNFNGCFCSYVFNFFFDFLFIFAFIGSHIEF